MNKEEKTYYIVARKRDSALTINYWEVKEIPQSIKDEHEKFLSYNRCYIIKETFYEDYEEAKRICREKNTDILKELYENLEIMRKVLENNE